MKNHASFIASTLFVFSLMWPLAQSGIEAAEDQTAEAAEQAIVVAKVNGTEITEQMVLEQISWIVREARQRLSPNQLAQKELVFFHDALERAIRSSLLNGVARAEKIIIDEAKLDQQVLDLRENFPSEEKYNQALASQGLNEDRLRQILRENLTHRGVIEAKVKRPDSATQEAVKKFYAENENSFLEPEQVRASHILLRVPSGSSGEKKESTRNKLVAIRTDIKSDKMSFEEAAKQHSEDPGTAPRGGDLGYFPRDRMVKPFEQTAFSTPVGEISDVVESQYGFHLIKVVDHKQPRRVPLDEVKGKIQQFLDQQNYRNAVNTYVNGLREKAQIETLVSEEEWSARYSVK